MTQHVERTRDFPRTYGTRHPHVDVADEFAAEHPISGGAPPVRHVDWFDPPQGPPGQPFAGMDPSQPVTHIRPWNPQPGMIGYLNFDGAAAQGDSPMGGTWRNPMRDRKTTRRRIR